MMMTITVKGRDGNGVFGKVKLNVEPKKPGLNQGHKVGSDTLIIFLVNNVSDISVIARH